MPDFAVVAKGTLQQLPASGTVGINGNVYAAGVNRQRRRQRFLTSERAVLCIGRPPVNVTRRQHVAQYQFVPVARDNRLDPAAASASPATHNYRQ
jgi:hypothetical protein